MFAEALLPFRGRGQLPHRLHLLVAVVAFHAGVVEEMFGFRVDARPQKRLVSVGEVATGEVWRRIGFVPRDVVEDFEAQSLKREADGVDVVRCSAHPQRAVGFEEATTFAQPRGVELVDVFGRGAGVPRTFIDAHHLPVLTGDAARREEIRRVGEDEVEGLGFRARKEVERVALIQAQPACGVVENGLRSFVDEKRFANGRWEIMKRLEYRERESDFGMNVDAGGNGQGDQDRIRDERIGSRAHSLISRKGVKSQRNSKKVSGISLRLGAFARD